MKNTKIHLLTRLLQSLIIITISFTSILTLNSLSTLVYAEDYDFDEGDPSVAGTKGYEGGPSWSRSGVIFYLVDENGKYAGVKPVFYTTSHAGFVDRNEKPISSKNNRVYARLTLMRYSEVKTGAIDLWGPPWGSNGELRGVEIREWLTTIDETGHSRAATLIKDMYGKDYAIKYENKELYLVFEAVGWNNIFMDGVNTGICLADKVFRIVNTDKNIEIPPQMPLYHGSTNKTVIPEFGKGEHTRLLRTFT